MDPETVRQRLAAVRSRFEKSAATAPLAKHDDATLLAWDAKKWDFYLENDLMPFVRRAERPQSALAIAPTRYQLEALAAGAPADVVLYPQQRLAEFCRQQDTALIDLMGAFGTDYQAAAEGYFRADDYLHFTDRGHNRVAAFFWRQLEDAIRRNR